MKKYVLIFFIALFFLCLLMLFGFQEQQKLLPPEKHEVGVRLVLVDVIVKKDSEFVTDLKKEDFALYEDGKEVPVNSFELISFGKRELVTLEEKPEKVSTDVPKKQLVVVFDGVSSWQRTLKEGGRKIVDELVSLAKLGNEVMIIQLSETKGIEVLQSFTIEEELIRKAVIRASASLWLDKSLDGIKMYQEIGLAEAGTGEDAMALAEKYMDRIHPSLEQERLYMLRGQFERALGGVLAVANMIKGLPGRKSILLISDGIPDVSAKTLDSQIDEMTPERTVSGARTPQLDIRRDTGTIRVFDPFNILNKKKIMSGEEVLRELIRFANAQNISIYALDPDTFTRYLIPSSAEFGPKEIITQPLDLRAEEKLRKIQNLTWLSEDTGGVSLKGAKKYERFYEVISTDLNYYYQLSYYPPRKEPDDQYHQINVKVERSGVDVRFRKGYTDYSEKEELKMSLVSAFYNPSVFKELPFEGEFILFYKDSKKFEPWMNVALPSRKLFIERGVASGPKQFSLHVYVKDKQRGEGAFGGQIPLAFNVDDAFMDVLKTTDYLIYHFKGGEIPFSQREYQAIFVLCDEQTNEMGGWEETISLPDFKNDKQGALINCVLGFIIPNEKKEKKSFSVSQKDGSLEYGEIKFFPSVSNQFQRMQDASVFLQIYLPQGKIDFSPEFKISGKGRLSQRIPGELIAESWDKKAKIWNGIFNLNLRTVIYGDYSLKVEIPVSAESAALSKEVKLTKLRY